MKKSKLIHYLGIKYVNFVKENIEKDGFKSTCQSNHQKLIRSIN